MTPRQTPRKAVSGIRSPDEARRPSKVARAAAALAMAALAAIGTACATRTVYRDVPPGSIVLPPPPTFERGQP